jgi:hypothetical protein
LEILHTVPRVYTCVVLLDHAALKQVRHLKLCGSKMTQQLAPIHHLFLQAVDAQQQLAESRAEWEVALQVLRQDKAAATAQLRKAMVSWHCHILLVLGSVTGQRSSLHTCQLTMPWLQLTMPRLQHLMGLHSMFITYLARQLSYLIPNMCMGATQRHSTTLDVLLNCRLESMQKCLTLTTQP